MLAFDVSHYSCVNYLIDCKALNFSRWGITTNLWGITTNHWGITARSKVTSVGYNYQPGSYTPVKPFEPPTHWDTIIIIKEFFSVIPRLKVVSRMAEQSRTCNATVCYIPEQ